MWSSGALLSRPARLSTRPPGPPRRAARATHRVLAKLQAVPVEFELPTKLPAGKAAFIVGSCQELGAWQLDAGRPMTWTADDVWRSTVELPAGENVEYKYVIVEQDKHREEWQKGANRSLTVDGSAVALRVRDDWAPNGMHDVVPQQQEEELAEAIVGQVEANPGTLVDVEFRLTQKLKFGSRMCLVGSHPSLGAWNLADACKMTWMEGHVWSASIQVPPGDVLEYKYVVVTDNGAGKPESVEWQQGAANRVVQLAPCAARATVEDTWRPGTDATVTVEMSSQPAETSSESAEVAAVVEPVTVESTPMLDTDEIEIVTPSGQILSGMTVRELKDQLRDLGLDPTGRKVTLISRLSEYLSQDMAP